MGNSCYYGLRKYIEFKGFMKKIENSIKYGNDSFLCIRDFRSW